MIIPDLSHNYCSVSLPWIQPCSKTSSLYSDWWKHTVVIVKYSTVFSLFIIPSCFPLLLLLLLCLMCPSLFFKLVVLLVFLLFFPLIPSFLIFLSLCSSFSPSFTPSFLLSCSFCLPSLLLFIGQIALKFRTDIYGCTFYDFSCSVFSGCQSAANIASNSVISSVWLLVWGPLTPLKDVILCSRDSLFSAEWSHINLSFRPFRTRA